LSLQRSFLDEDASESQGNKSEEASGSVPGRGGEKAEIISAAAAVVRETQCGYVSVATKSCFSFV
jgi:hypothetical protein